jgi:hypothetical protein
MRVEVNMSKPFRGHIEQYSDHSNTTMPQAYKELLLLGLVCSNMDLNALPASKSSVQNLADDRVDIDTLID